MRWLHATANIPVEKGKDILGNEIVTAYEHRPILVRMTNWTLEERTALDPEYTRVNRKILTRERVSGAESITVEGADYIVTERIITPRWTILHARSYKQ